MIPLSLIRQFDTVRLIPSRYAEQEDSVLAPLSDDTAELHEVFELDNATSERLRGEFGALPGIGVDELVFGVPHFRMVNAAYTYTRPQGNRFNVADRGAWYCAFDAETALAEVVFHKIVEYTEIGRFHDSVSYQSLLADFAGHFHDLRGNRRFARYLAPQSYVDSQALATDLLEQGSMGIVYPSVRHQGGTCLACFRPALVANVRKERSYRLTWRGKAQPEITLVP